MLASDAFGTGCGSGLEGPLLERKLTGVPVYAILLESSTNLKKSWNRLGHARGGMP